MRHKRFVSLQFSLRGFSRRIMSHSLVFMHRCMGVESSGQRPFVTILRIKPRYAYF